MDGKTDTMNNRTNSLIVLVFVIIATIIMLIIYFAPSTDGCTSGNEAICTTEERIDIWTARDTPSAESCQYCQEPDNEMCQYISMCQGLYQSCAEMGYYYNFEVNFAECLKGGCETSLSRCPSVQARYEYCEDPKNATDCHLWCWNLKAITHPHQIECQEKGLCQRFIGDAFFSVCAEPEASGSCGNDLERCDPKDFNAYCIANKDNTFIYDKCSEACIKRTTPTTRDSPECDVADFCAFTTHETKYAICDVNPCGANIETCGEDNRANYCKYKAPECYTYCASQDTYMNSAVCSDMEMCVNLAEVYEKTFAKCLPPCYVSLDINCNDVERYGYCRSLKSNTCRQYCQMSNDAQGNLSCDNQLMCIEAGINPDLFKHCTKCDTMTLEDCNSSDVDIICYNNFALSTVCQEKCWTWQEDNLPSFCTRYTKWNEYNTCYTEGLNADGCDKWMMDSYCINQDCVDWDCVVNLEDVPEKCIDKNCLSRNCYNECQEQRACNNETCRQMDNYNSYCNPCSMYGLDSIQCLSDNKYMDEYCAENGIICDNYCKNYNRFKPYAVNTVCEHPYCSDVCDSCLQGLDKDGCDANEFCYRGGLLNGDLYFGYCENECNSYLNILCNNNIEVCYRFNSSPCSYRICEQDQCTIKKYNSLITKYSYSIMSVSGMKLGYNIHYISDIPTDLQILRSDTDIDIFNGQINEWIIRVKSNRVSLLSTLFPSHGLNIRGKLSLAGYTTNEIDENSTNQLEFIGVEGEGLFLIRIPDTNLFLGIGDVYSFREIDNMDDFVWQIIENKHYDNVNVPMMYNPRDVLGYFRGATMKVEGYTMTFVGNVSGGSSKKYGGGLYMRGGRNTYWGPNKHITKRYTNDTMEAWTGCLITYDTQYYITADEEAIKLGIVEMDDKDKFAENIYYFLFYSDQKVFSLVSFYDVDGYHYYLGGLDKAEWITNGEPWRLTFNDDAIFGRNVVFSKDLVYLYYPFNLLYMNYDKDNDIPGGCSNPPEGLEYDSEPAPSDVPRMNFGKKKALIELNGENITHPAPEKFTMRMVDSDLYVGLGGDGHLITFCETEYKWLQMTTDTNQMWNMTGEYPWKYNNRQGFIINNQQMGVCQHIYCCDLNVTLDTDNEVIYIQPSLVDPDQPPLCSELPLVVGGESFEFVFVDATNYDL